MKPMIPKDKKIKFTLKGRAGRRSTAATQSQSPAVVKSNRKVQKRRMARHLNSYLCFDCHRDFISATYGYPVDSLPAFVSLLQPLVIPCRHCTRTVSYGPPSVRSIRKYSKICVNSHSKIDKTKIFMTALW